MSLSETYLSRKKLLADNLKSMGVSSVNETDGLTTLINAVLNIEPSIGGLDLDTSLVITTTQEIIGLGESIILTSTLRASYDDTTVVDVDLSGVLTGATVKFYNGTTLLGTAITDLNGIATYTYTPSQPGNFTFHTVFEGTENFTNCNSNNVNITVTNPPTSLVLQADKSILSYYDNDKCVLTATLYDNNNTPMEGLSVVFKNGDIVLATITTNSSGVAEYTYNSQGVGDVTITAECMNLTETYSISDRLYYWNGIEDHSSDFTLGLCEGGTVGSVTFDSTLGLHFLKGSKATIDYVSIPLPVNCEIEVTFESAVGGTKGIGLTSGNGNADICIIDGNTIGSYRYTNSSWKGTLYTSKPYGSETYPLTGKLVKQDRTCYFEVNGVQSNTFIMQFASDTVIYTGVGGNANMNCYVSKFSIKPLP